MLVFSIDILINEWGIHFMVFATKQVKLRTQLNATHVNRVFYTFELEDWVWGGKRIGAMYCFGFGWGRRDRVWYSNFIY